MVRSYYDILRQQQFVHLQQQLHSNTQQQFTWLQQRYVQGLVDVTRVHAAERELQDVAAALLQAQTALQVAQAQAHLLFGGEGGYAHPGAEVHWPNWGEAVVTGLPS